MSIIPSEMCFENYLFVLLKTYNKKTHRISSTVS